MTAMKKLDIDLLITRKLDEFKLKIGFQLKINMKNCLFFRFLTQFWIENLLFLPFSAFTLLRLQEK